MHLKSLVVAALAAVMTTALPARTVPAYKGAIAVDAATGKVLIEDNADAVSPPASMTKLMTFAVLDDAIKRGEITMQTPVTVTAEDAKLAFLPKSTHVGLLKGEVFPVEELVYAMMLQSAQDAAYAVAHKVGGTVPAFVAAMNAKARELGMLHTTFRSPHGFPPPNHRETDGDLSTPRDYALLCRYLVLHTDILKYTSVRTRPFGAGIRLQPLLMGNHNRLLGRVPGVDGLKTGFTNDAGFCISATALRNRQRVIVVSMDSPDPKTRDTKVADMIDRAFVLMPLNSIFAPAQAAGAQPAVPAAPTRPSPAPAAPAGPVIHYNGAGGG